MLANDWVFGKSTNSISTTDGIILLLLLAGFLYFSFFKSDKSDVSASDQAIKEMPIAKSLGMIAAGIFGLFFGGKWIVGGVDQIAIDFELSQSVIGLTLIAIATSLPELVTSILAALRKNTDMAIGNAVGSNVFNIFLVLGTSALIKPIEYDTELNIEMSILFVSALLLVLFIQLNIGGLKRSISRTEGGILMALYLVFIYWSLFIN